MAVHLVSYREAEKPGVAGHTWCPSGKLRLHCGGLRSDWSIKQVSSQPGLRRKMNTELSFSSVSVLGCAVLDL